MSDQLKTSEREPTAGLAADAGWPCLDLESDPNSALVRYPYGYAEFGGSRFGRERYAKMFLAIVTEDRRARRIEELARECASWHLGDGDECGAIARELNDLLANTTVSRDAGAEGAPKPLNA